jgi:hypothetical protein
MLMCVPFPAHGAVLGQDGDAALFFDGVVVHHGVDHLFVVGKGAGLAQQLVDHGGFAMVNVGDDGDVADLFVIVFPMCRCAWTRNAACLPKFVEFPADSAACPGTSSPP